MDDGYDFLLPCVQAGQVCMQSSVACQRRVKWSEVKEMDAQTAYTTVLPSHPIPKLRCFHHLRSFIYFYVCADFACITGAHGTDASFVQTWQRKKGNKSNTLACVFVPCWNSSYPALSWFDWHIGVYIFWSLLCCFDVWPIFVPCMGHESMTHASTKMFFFLAPARQIGIAQVMACWKLFF